MQDNKPTTDVASFAASQAADLYETDNLGLFAALATLGVPYTTKAAGGIIRVTGDSITDPAGRIVWCFEKQSTDGKVKTSEVVARWNDKAWMEKAANDPDPHVPGSITAHILAAIRYFHLNYRSGAKIVKEARQFELIRAGKFRLFLAKDADTATQNQFFKRAGI